jgi:hypothetical protein
MNHGATLRRALLAVLLIAAAFVVTAPQSASAIAGGNTYCEYYSDGTYTTQVGWCGPDCCGNFSCSGEQTKYKICGAFNCVWCPPGGES